MTIPAVINEPVPLAMILEDGNETLYPQATVYASGQSTPTAIIDMQHTTKGIYEANWTPTNLGTYTAHFIIYTDVFRSVESIVYTREAEQIFVSQSNVDSLAQEILRVLGLLKENAYIDNTEHDAANQMTYARIRIFDSKENALLATDGGSETQGLIATYTMQTVYESLGRMGSYRMVKEG